MKKEEYQQLELFSQGKENNQREARLPRLVLNFIWTWEKTILIIIALVITGIVCFSLGVEKGKRVVQLKTDSRLDIALKKTQKIQAKPSSLPAQQRDTQAQPQAGKKQDELGELLPNYTIQVASYASRTSAQREADNLKKKGLTSMVMPKGKFIIVCVGNFSKKEEAEYLLLKLKKQYQDCRIRRL